MGHRQLESLLADTVMLLCKNGLQFHSRLKIEGLIGITVDSTVFLVNLNEEIRDESGSALLCQDNNSDDRFNTGSRKNQFKPVEKTLKPVITKNMPSPKRNDSTSLAVRYHTVRPQRIESKVTSMECEQVDANESNLGEDDDCAVVGEILVKQELMFDNCVKDQNDDNLFQNSKDSLSLNKQHTVPLVTAVENFSISNTNNESLELPHGDNFTASSYSLVQHPSSSLSSFTHYKHNKTDVSDVDDNRRSLTSIKAHGAKRRFGTPTAQHINFKRVDTVLQNNGSNAFVLSQSVHICGYPQCGKQFQHKHHLLRHQTRKHGREPMRNRRSYGYDSYYPSSQQHSFVDEDNGEENYYDNDNRVMSASSQPLVDGLSSLQHPGEAIDEKYSSECGRSPFVVNVSY